jgi:hypothetical protein
MRQGASGALPLARIKLADAESAWLWVSTPHSRWQVANKMPEKGFPGAGGYEHGWLISGGAG